MWQGTKKRPGSKLVEETENMGAHLEILTERQQTTVNLTTEPKNMKQSLEIAGDVMFNSAYDPKGTEEVRAAVNNANEVTDVNTQDLIYDRLHQVCFRDTALGNSAFPTEITDLTHDDVVQYREQNFTADRLVVSAAGQVDHQEVCRQAEGLFGGLKNVKRPVEERPYFCGASLNYRNDEMGPTAYFSIGWEGVPWRSPFAVHFMIIAAYVGKHRAFQPGRILPAKLSGNMLENAVANKGEVGCAQYYEARNFFFRDTGLFTIYGEADEVALQPLISELQFSINKLSHAVVDEEIERAKRDLKVEIFSQRDGTLELCNSLATQIQTLGRYVSPEELVHRIDAVDCEDVKRIAYDKLHDSEISITLLGPTHGFGTYHNLRFHNMMRRY